MIRMNKFNIKPNKKYMSKNKLGKNQHNYNLNKYASRFYYQNKRH